MITEAVLDQAVAKGLIGAGQAEALRSLARQEAPLPVALVPAPDDEAFRFVSGFADIFVTIGIVLFLGAAAYLLGRLGPPIVVASAVSALSWGLAEFFTRRRRMALPSIVLLVIFALACFSAVANLPDVPGPPPRFARSWLVDVFGLGTARPLATARAAVATAGLVLLHYRRFRVPITVAAGTGMAALTVLMLAFSLAPVLVGEHFNLVTLICGIAVFALAMRYDRLDPERSTRRTDIAFWLHLLAAPLIVHSLFTALGVTRSGLGAGTATLVLALFAVLGLVAVVIDRRALLVSGLVYAGTAFGSLIRQVGITDYTVPVTLLVLGALVLGLSAGWQPLRRALLLWIPLGAAFEPPRSA